MSTLHEQLVTIVATRLGETEANPIEQIRRLVERAGPEKVVQLVKDAQAIYAKGGLMVKNGSRQRTLGGCFFHLARHYGGLTRKDRAYCFLPFNTTKAPSDELEASVQSFAGETMNGKDIVTHRVNAVNRQHQERYNARPNPTATIPT